MHSRHSTETTNDNITQGAEMTRKQHKRGYISKLHKSRENSHEMLFDVSYKSDTMTTNGRAAGVQNIVLNQSTLSRTKVVQRWRAAVATWWRGEVNICGRKICHSWKNILTKCVDNNTNMMYYKIEARVKTKPILYKPIFILPPFKFTPFNIEERQVNNYVWQKILCNSQVHWC
jgi:hypothetical protein